MSLSSIKPNTFESKTQLLPLSYCDESYGLYLYFDYDESKGFTMHPLRTYVYKICMGYLDFFSQGRLRQS